MPIANPPSRYESTVSPEPRNFSADGASATLGVSNTTGIANAFIGGVGATSDAQQQALIDARRIMDRAEDHGENLMFPQYRRNFIPANKTLTEEDGGTLTEEYKNVRNKTMSPADVAAAKLGTAYTPTVASPGVGHGIDPVALRSVSSVTTQVLATGPVDLDNPSAEAHQNSGQGASGAVRRFKLGVGSGLGNPAEPRGQFPRPPT